MTGVLDVGEIAPRDRQPAIFDRHAALRAGETFELRNDHDPRPLRYQFETERPGGFTWAPLEAGPTVWRVAIGRPA